MKKLQFKNNKCTKYFYYIFNFTLNFFYWITQLFFFYFKLTKFDCNSNNNSVASGFMQILFFFFKRKQTEGAHKWRIDVFFYYYYFTPLVDRCIVTREEEKGGLNGE